MIHNVKNIYIYKLNLKTRTVRRGIGGYYYGRTLRFRCTCRRFIVSEHGGGGPSVVDMTILSIL